MYTTAKLLFTITKFELVGKKEFAATTLYPEDETFVVYVVTLVISDDIHSFCKIQIVLFKVNKTPTTVLSNQLNFVDIFSMELTVEFPKHIEIINYTINLIDGK